MKPSIRKCFLLALGIIMTPGTHVFGLELQDPSIINLNTAVHFLTPDGTNVLLRPGNYTVKATDGALQFIPESGDLQVVEAEASTHEEEIDAPLAISLPGEEKDFRDMHLVMLLLPDGQSLETQGSYSGIRDRAISRKRIARYKKRARTRIRRKVRRYRPSHAYRPAGGRLRVKDNRLAGLWIHEESVSKEKKAQISNGKWIWPGVYDVIPKFIHFTWDLDVPSSAIQKIIDKQGYGFEVKLNQRRLVQGTDGYSGDFYATRYTPESDALKTCPQGKTCLGTTIRHLPWLNTTPPWTVEVSYWKIPLKAATGRKNYLRMPGSDAPLVRDKPVKKTTVAGVIYPNATTGKSYFTHKVYPIFQHERCISCHTLGSKAEIVNRHGGLLSEDDIQVVQGHVGANYACGGGCHVSVPETIQPVDAVQFYDTEWKTPHFNIGIDWRGKSAQYICQKVRSTLPTLEKKRKHLFHDSRIAWAVVSGKVPLGRPTLPTVPPGNYWKFKNLLELWIRSGSPCPK